MEAGHHQRACDAGLAALASAAPDSVEAERIVESLGRLPASLHVGGHAMDLGEWLTCWQAEHRPELVLAGGIRDGSHPFLDVDSRMTGRRSALQRARFHVHWPSSAPQQPRPTSC